MHHLYVDVLAASPAHVCVQGSHGHTVPQLDDPFLQRRANATTLSSGKSFLQDEAFLQVVVVILSPGELVLTSSMTLLLSSPLLLLPPFVCPCLLPFAGHAASFEEGVSIERERAKTSGSPRASTSTLSGMPPPTTPKPVHELFVGHNDECKGMEAVPV